MPSPVIECVELTKAYSKRIVALNNLTLTINEGASFGLLGENGAGKSTLVRLLMGFIFPTSGRVRVLGEEKVARAHQRIGYVHERPIFETRFKGRAYLTYLGELSGLWGTRTRPVLMNCSNGSICTRRQTEPSGRTRRGCCSGWLSRRRC
jgi:ABC-type multidrug transport system ATPase subunit